jgi:cell division protein FtsI (penicillin-binding protein 3)
MKPFDPDDRHPGPIVHMIEPQLPTPRGNRFMAFVRNLMHTRIDKSTHRIHFVAFAFVGLYAVISGKLIWLGMKPDTQSLRRAASEAVSASRPDVIDRNGDVLASDVKTMSIFAEPRRIIDKDEAVELLTAVLPGLNARELRERLGSRKGFVWIKRAVTPKERRKTSASIRTAHLPPMCSASPMSTTTALPASKNSSTARASAISTARASSSPPLI